MGRIKRLFRFLRNRQPEGQDEIREGMARNLEAQSELWGRTAERSTNAAQRQQASEMQKTRADQASRLRSKESVLIEGLFGVNNDRTR